MAEKCTVIELPGPTGRTINHHHHHHRRDLRSAFTLPKIHKDIKLNSLLVTLLKTLNLFNTKNLQIKHCKYSQFKTDIKKKIKEIYEASCFKMDPILIKKNIMSH